MIVKRNVGEGKVMLRNRAVFLARLAVLLKEGYTFYDGLKLLLPHHMKNYEFMITDIEDDFRKGLTVSHILSRLGFSSGTLLPVAIAERDGRLAEALEGMSVRLEKTEEVKKRLKSLLAYPAVLFAFITVLLIGFRRFFLPNMEALSLTRQQDQDGIGISFPMLVAKIPDLIFGVGIVTILIGIGCRIIYKKLTAAKKIRFFTRIPIAANLFTMWKTRLFASEIGSLLQSGLSIQDSLEVLIRQVLDPVLGEMAKNVKGHIIYGEPFHEAVILTDGLTKQLASFAEHGSNSGHLSKELIIYSEYLDDTINLQLSKGLAILQPVLFSLIAICILAAYIALLLPIYGMIDKV